MKEKATLVVVKINNFSLFKGKKTLSEQNILRRLRVICKIVSFLPLSQIYTVRVGVLLQANLFIPCFFQWSSCFSFLMTEDISALCGSMSLSEYEKLLWISPKLKFRNLSNVEKIVWFVKSMQINPPILKRFILLCKKCGKFEAF